MATKINSNVDFTFTAEASLDDDQITSIARQHAIQAACAGRNVDGAQMERISREAVVNIRVDIVRFGPNANVSVQGSVKGMYQ